MPIYTSPVISLYITADIRKLGVKQRARFNMYWLLTSCGQSKEGGNSSSLETNWWDDKVLKKRRNVLIILNLIEDCTHI